MASFLLPLIVFIQFFVRLYQVSRAEFKEDESEWLVKNPTSQFMEIRTDR